MYHRFQSQRAEILLAELTASIDSAAATAIGVNDERARGIFEPPGDNHQKVATPGAILTWKSIVFRHALRAGVAAGVAVALTEVLDLKRGYRMTFSAIIILQPCTSATLRKGLQTRGWIAAFISDFCFLTSDFQ